MPLVHANDLSYNTTVETIRVKLFTHGLEACEILSDGLVCSSVQVGILGAYSRIQILEASLEDLSSVLRPVRPARELIDESVRQVVIWNALLEKHSPTAIL